MPLYELDPEQHATLLASLRSYQYSLDTDPKDRREPEHHVRDIKAIATNEGEIQVPLDTSDIDLLCETLNTPGIELRQGYLIDQNRLLAVIVSTEDIKTAYNEYTRAKISGKVARQLLSDYKADISEKFVSNWMDTVINVLANAFDEIMLEEAEKTKKKKKKKKKET